MPTGSTVRMADLIVVLDGAKVVSRVAPIEITFSKPVNPGTVAANGVRLLDTNGAPVTASVSLEKGDSGFRINRIELVTEASVPGIDEAAFQDQAETAKANCPVSQALAGTQITLKATLV